VKSYMLLFLILYVVSISPKIVYTISCIYPIEKVLKYKYWKWIHILHLELLVRSHNQKKCKESNWQFDLQPLNPKKQGSNDLQWKHKTWCWKYPIKGYNFSIWRCSIKIHMKEFLSVKFFEIHNLGILRLPLWILKLFIHLM
jgi:hypothetical protein